MKPICDDLSRSVLVVMMFAILSCRPAVTIQPKEIAHPGSRALVSHQEVSIVWTCFSNRTEPNSSLNNQEEYCQWTRRVRNPSGPLQCEFTTNFDQTRPFFLTKGRFTKEFSMAYINSQAFLIGGKEPDYDATRKGILRACAEHLGQCIEDCKCYRKSDPQLCKVVGTVVKNSCTARVIAEPAVLFDVPSDHELKDPIVALQLLIPPGPRGLSKYCKYESQVPDAAEKMLTPARDPDDERTFVRCIFSPNEAENYATCDDVARLMTVNVRFKIENCTDLSLSRIKEELNGKFPDACAQ